MKAPPARVFALICAPERLPEWNVSVAHARRVTPDEPVGPGSRAIMSGRLLGQSLESETEVVEFDAPNVFVTRAIRGPRLTTRFSLDAVEDGTDVKVDVMGDVPGGAIGERLAEGFLRRELTTSLRRLQALLEADAQESIA
ncbi:MAG: SRPBCC family protein [Chloroflexi bacterium]|nr:SRPBCC family protein [Chloroflexota bacterium]MBV9600562.1 SRPBCC family protein [Chloroflexota bacterium]